MYQDFGHTSLGFIRVDTQALSYVISRRLPRGVQCSAVRLRPHDRLCLVVISDRREFWSREDDMRRAKAIADDLRSMGVELPRLRWIRQNGYLEQHPLYAEHPLYRIPSFWMTVAGCIFAFFALDWRLFAAYILVLIGVWLLSAWLISGGWNRIVKSMPFGRK